MVKKQAKVIGYKGFNKGLICRGFQYEIGKTYTEEKAKLCSAGFHYCANPLDVLDFYYLIDSEFAIIEAVDPINDDKKSVTKNITINAKLDLLGFIKASIDFIWKDCDKTSNNIKVNDDNSAKLASSGDYAKLASSGNSAKLASSGNYAKLASSGHYAQLASSGDSAQLASSGNYAKLASSGDYAKLASSGDYAKLASSGDYAKLASSGNYAKLASSGDSAQLEANGEDSIVAGIGYNNIAKASKGSWIVLAEWVNSKPKYIESVQVDGKKIKADTFYRLIDGKFVEQK
jgi:hypothetical protein